MKRKTPLKRSTTPIKRKAAPKAKRSTINKNRELREAVLKRCLFTDAAGDEWPRCEMLVYIGDGWERCFNVAIDPSHVIKRTDCGRAKHSADVCVGSCRRCHEAYHAHSALIMFPTGALERANAAINSARLKRRGDPF